MPSRGVSWPCNGWTTRSGKRCSRTTLRSWPCSGKPRRPRVSNSRRLPPARLQLCRPTRTTDSIFRQLGYGQCFNGVMNPKYYGTLLPRGSWLTSWLSSQFGLPDFFVLFVQKSGLKCHWTKFCTPLTETNGWELCILMNFLYWK